MRHGTNIGTSECLPFPALFARVHFLSAANIFMRHGTNVVAVVRFAPPGRVHRGILMRHRPNIWSVEGFFPSALIVSATDIVVRHRANIGTSEDLLLTTVVFARVYIVMLGRTHVRTVRVLLA